MPSTEERVFVSPLAVAADIARELREHPDHWTKGFNARNADGLFTGVHDPGARCWCLHGHILKRNAEFALATIGAAFGYPNVSWSCWNDADERTVGDVIALCERVSAILRAATTYQSERYGRDCEPVTAIRIHRKQVGERTFDAITVILSDLHLSCDAVNDRHIRCAACLATASGVALHVSSELKERVGQALGVAKL